MASGLSDVIRKLEEQKAAIEKALAALNDLDGSAAGVAAPARRGRPPKRKGGMTAAGRRRLSEALKARWAAKKAAATAKPAKAKKKGGLTAAGRKKLSEALKARWAAKRAAAATKKK